MRGGGSLAAFPGVPASLNRLRAHEAEAQSLAPAPLRHLFLHLGRIRGRGNLELSIWMRRDGNRPIPQGQQGRARAGGAGLQDPAHDCWSQVCGQEVSPCAEGPNLRA